jgi:hypothetical protein
MPIRPTVLPAFAVFAAAARHQNFAHAAEELHLTASAVSHHVRRLETTLGVTLFQRHGWVRGKNCARELFFALSESRGELSSKQVQCRAGPSAFTKKRNNKIRKRGEV